MKVFITGATGNIGSAVVAELLANNHTVIGLARSDASAQKLAAAGATPVRGALTDLDVIRRAAMDADGVIHLAFSNDFSSPEAVVAGITEETAAITVMGEALIGSAKPLVVCSGTPWIPGRHSTEADALPTEGPLGGRARTVNRTLALSTQGVRASAVRLPRTVHQNGDGGFAGVLTHVARETGVSGYPGDGTQRWPAVHSADAAALFRLALEKAPAGTSWHAVADDGDQVRDIAAVIGRRLGVPTRQVPAETYGPLGEVFVIDQPSSSATTREALGWNPTHPSLLEDLELVQP